MSVKRKLLAFFGLVLFYAVTTPIFPYMFASLSAFLRDYNLTIIDVPYMVYNATSHSWNEVVVRLDITGIVMFALCFVYIAAPILILWRMLR